MKDKNLPNDNNSKSLEELTNDANNIIELLENEIEQLKSLAVSPKLYWEERKLLEWN